MAEYEAKRASNAPNSPDVNKKVSDSIVSWQAGGLYLIPDCPVHPIRAMSL